MLNVPHSLRRRFTDLVASIYLYNEHRGYTGLEEFLAAARRRFPGDRVFLAGVQKHLDDERRHYRMFRAYFEAGMRMPYAISSEWGYVDRLLAAVGLAGNGKDAAALEAADGSTFAAVCRMILLTEERGLRQVERVLAWPWVREDHRLAAIFTVIRRDEPSGPWPDRPTPRERLADLVTHHRLVHLSLPLAYANPRLVRRVAFPA
jgi:hypothetical protein